MFFRRSDRNYRKSKQIESVNFYVSKTAKVIAKKLLQTMSTASRQKLGEQLLAELSLLAEIDLVKLKISDKKQYHARRGGRIVMRQYGYYRPASHYIYITNRTAARGQLIAPKTFLETLLHEWTHHYDHEKLKLNSIHTSGFYARLNSLRDQLVI